MTERYQTARSDEEERLEAQAREQIERVNERADVLVKRLGLPSEARYDLLGVIFANPTPASPSEFSPAKATLHTGINSDERADDSEYEI